MSGPVKHLSVAADQQGMDDEPIAGEEYVRIPSGKYTAQLIKVKTEYYQHFRSKKDTGKRVECEYCIIDGKYMGLILYRYYMWREQYSKGMDYYDDYLVLNGGNSPVKSSRMSFKHHIRSIAEIWVDLTKRRHRDKTVKENIHQYSVVKEVIRLLQKNGKT